MWKQVQLSTANDDSGARQWLTRAVDDLSWTQANISSEIWYGACFTAQQAAEKALKAYIASQGKSVIRTHDLNALLQECVEADTIFEQFRRECATLTDYYVTTRYPDIAQYVDFTEYKAKEAFGFAERIVMFVREQLGA
ncbi:MAG: HEPN domain-containing protein [Dehalococcoidia bacterium]|nr:HEPN domain-containing protein [Dehalococcoidia bacterium]